MHSKAVRTVCFSHREHYLENKKIGHKCQLFCKVQEDAGGIFQVEASVFDLNEARLFECTKTFNSLKKSLNWVVSIFNDYEGMEFPEVLYLPEWSEKKDSDSYTKKWIEGMFLNPVEEKIFTISA